MASDLTTRIDRPRAMILADALDQETEQRSLLKSYVERHMQEGTDFGVIPGTRNRTLLKPGAEKLTQIFRCTPRYRIDEKIEDWTSGLFYYRFVCQVVTQADDVVVAEGVGSCSSYESKYRWRNANRKCPQCGVEAIIKGKAEYGGGWLCWKKKDGCGAQFEEADPTIVGQQVGRVQNPDLADVANTVLKMAKKRSLVDAAIALARCSDIFTQDLDEEHLAKGEAETPAPTPGPASPKSTNGVTVWTLPEAVAKCQEAGISRDELMAHLRSAGQTAYKKHEHTALVQAMIVAKKTGAKPVPDTHAEPDPDEQPPAADDDGIPFSLWWLAPLLLSLTSFLV